MIKGRNAGQRCVIQSRYSRERTLATTRTQRTGNVSRKGCTFSLTIRYEDVTRNSSRRVDRLSIIASHFLVSRAAERSSRAKLGSGRSSTKQRDRITISRIYFLQKISEVIDKHLLIFHPIS